MIMRVGGVQQTIILHPSKYRNVLCKEFLLSYLKGSKFVRESVISGYRQKNKKLKKQEKRKVQRQGNMDR